MSISLIIFLTFFPIFTLTSCESVRVSKDEVDNSIKDNLPLGSSISQVMAFLKSREIEQHPYTEDLEPLFAPSEAEPTPEKKRFILARIPDVKRKGLSKWDMYVVFYFDEEGRLIEYKIKTIGTGL